MSKSCTGSGLLVQLGPESTEEMKGFSVPLRALLPAPDFAKIWNHSHYFQHIFFLRCKTDFIFFSL